MNVQLPLGSTLTYRHVSDKQFFLFMAVLLLATAIVGFAPNTLAILAGERMSPPISVHVHAALMLAWLLLLVAQTGLSSSGHLGRHRQLGMVALVLVPAIVLVMVFASYERLASAEIHEPIRYNILLLQLRSIVLFPLFAFWAIACRRSSSSTHKRLMIVATVVVMDAALARMGWLPGPGSRHASYEPMSAYQLLLLTPLVIHDLLRSGRMHRATMGGVGLFALSAVVVNQLWGSEWWLETAEGAMRLLR